MARLDLEALSKVFPGEVVAVRGVSLSVAEGELLALVGPSGCGKTTTLRLIAGLERADAGDVRVAGKSVSGLSPDRRDVAMVFPRGALYPHLTVYENLAWGARLRDGGGWTEPLFRKTLLRKMAGWLRGARVAEAGARFAERDQRVRGVADQLGIGALLDRLPSQLSDGQRQRVALGRAMVRRPSVYLMDEPLTGLDAPLRNQLRRELKAWHEATRATVVCVTHDQTEALMLGDRVAVMHEGQLQQVGSPRDVYERPSNRFVAGFIGSPPMNLIEGELLDGEREGELRFRAGAWSLPLPRGDALREYRGRRVVLGVRPEHIGTLNQREGKGIRAGKEIASGLHDETAAERAAERVVAEKVIDIDGVVQLVESAGDFKVVYVEPPPKLPGEGGERVATGSASDHLTVKWNADEMPRAGDALRLSLDPRRLHVFDAASGANLTLPQSG